jgi:hypothetical protein
MPVAAPVATATPAAPAAGAAAPRAPFHEVLQRQLSPPPAPAPPLRPSPPALEALGGIERARVALDRALAEARAGRTFSPAELLALQADAYRFGHAIDVASKVAEAGAQSVKQAVHTQV